MDPMAAGEKIDSLRQRDFSQWSAVVEFLRLTLSRIGATGQRESEPYLFSTVVTRRLSTDSPRHNDRKREYCPSQIPRPAESIFHRQTGPGLHAGGASRRRRQTQAETSPRHPVMETERASSPISNRPGRQRFAPCHWRVVRESSADHPQERT